MPSADGKSMFVPAGSVVIDKKLLAELQENLALLQTREAERDMTADEAPKEEETEKSLFNKLKDRF